MITLKQKMMSKLLPDNVEDYLKQFPWLRDISTLTWQQKLSLAGSGVFGLSVVWYLWKRYQDRNLPPGPTGWPIVGCTDLMEDYNYQSDLEKLGKRYGDIFSIQKGTNLLIVLNSYSAIKEAFVDQGDVFACRPGLSNTIKAMTLHDDVFATPYQTPGWNDNKAVMLSCLRAAGFGSNQAVETKVLEQVQMLDAYLDTFAKQGTPVDFREITPKATVNVIFQVVMSRKFDYDDPKLDEVIQIVRNWQDALTGAVLFDNLPEWLVKILFYKRAAAIFNRTEALRDLIRPSLGHHIETLNQDEPRDFIDIYLIKTGGTRPFSKMTDNILSLLPDASDTLSITMTWVFLYITHHPDVQDKIAAEIAALTGGNRYVTWADKKNLPYIEAVIMEVMRIEPPVTISVAHATSKEVIFRGYRIPTRAHVYGHTRAAQRDPRIFDDPEAFKPERFLNSEGQVFTCDGWFPYSMGRRRCVGESIAKMELFLFTANIVQKYRIRFQDGPKPTLDGMRHMLSFPQPYSVILTNRE